jgi:CRISPR system Cascade subunit CasA
VIEKRFNLIDEDWIPVAERGRVGLKTIFTDDAITALGGNPVQKVALFKLLLAIAQSAYTPKDERDWKQLGWGGMQKKVLEYLDKHYDCFWLYGEKPFLQMPEIEKICHEKCSDKNKKKQSVKIGNGTFPDLFPENNTIVSQFDYADISGSDADKTLFLITSENFAFYGKQIDKTICLEKNYEKSSIAKPGPSLGFNNYLHTFVFSDTILTSVYMNLITEAVLTDNPMIGQTIGIPFWEKMPQTEKCKIAQESKLTLVGHLVPLSRYMLFTDDGVYFTEGIQYQYSKADKKAGKAEADWIEPSFSWKYEDGELKGLYADVSKKPWRILDSLLVKKLSEMEYNNIVLKLVLGRIAQGGGDKAFSVWSGGLDVSGDAFGKKIKGTDDFVESEVQVSAGIFSNEEESAFFNLLSGEMDYMRNLESDLANSITRYYLCMTGKGIKKINLKEWKSVYDKETPLPKQQYWQLCESRFQQLVNACAEEPSGKRAKDMRKLFSSFVYQIYDRTCPKDTARQMEAWAENKPFSTKQEEKQSDE